MTIIEGYLANVYNGICDDLHLIDAIDYKLIKPYNRIENVISYAIGGAVKYKRFPEGESYEGVTEKKYRITIEEIE